MSMSEMLDRYRDGLKRELATLRAVHCINNLQEMIADSGED